MNNGNVNVVILLDLKKAFDVVDHDIMAKKLEIYVCLVCLMVFNATFNNISVTSISWRSVLFQDANTYFLLAGLH
jgi:hypothetical protein